MANHSYHKDYMAAYDRPRRARLEDFASPSPILTPGTTLFDGSPWSPVCHRPIFAWLASVLDGSTHRHDALNGGEYADISSTDGKRYPGPDAGIAYPTRLTLSMLEASLHLLSILLTIPSLPYGRLKSKPTNLSTLYSRPYGMTTPLQRNDGRSAPRKALSTKREQSMMVCVLTSYMLTQVPDITQVSR